MKRSVVVVPSLLALGFEDATGKPETARAIVGEHPSARAKAMAAYTAVRIKQG